MVNPAATPYNLSFPSYLSAPIIPSDNPTTVEGVLLGRKLFYEVKLSGNNSMSCGSCHKQQYAFGDTSAFSMGVTGMNGTRNTPGLSNVAWQTALFWDGRASSLENQVPGPIQNPIEMHQDLSIAVSELQATSVYPPLFKAAFGSSTITGLGIQKAIAQFERTLISSNSKFDQFIAGNSSAFTVQEHNGYILFSTHPLPQANIRGGNCGDCHGGYLQKNRFYENNGLDSIFADNGYGQFTGKSFDDGKFKVPSLRNIALTAPYMHDGRFKTLEEVLAHYNQHVVQSTTISPLMNVSNDPAGTTLNLTQQEIDDIIVFLHTLTDTTFTKNPKFSNPF
ncbi:MAG TPA: cytochrome c peroxidase [Cytophagaceae bacterium]|nr:cytochrome c peroxidase [Cytophagaceae bacterium]